MDSAVVALPEHLFSDAGLSSRAVSILDAAEELMEKSGWQNVSLRDLAVVIGVKVPSLYKHFSNREDLKTHLISRQLVRMGRHLWPVATPGNISGLMDTYRNEARRRPQGYRLATTGPLDRSALQPGLEDWVGDCFRAVTYGRSQLAQGVWAATHGAVILDLDTRYETGGMAEDTWRGLVDLMATAIDQIVKT